MKTSFIFARCFALALLVVLMVADLSAHTVAARPGTWELLGRRKVNYAADRDVIPVTARDGTFRKLQLRVKGAPIDLTRAVVHYANGQTQELNIRQRVPAGGQTRVLDLPGTRRVITKVVLIYDTRNRARHRATVELWGRR